MACGAPRSPVALLKAADAAAGAAAPIGTGGNGGGRVRLLLTSCMVVIAESARNIVNLSTAPAPAPAGVGVVHTGTPGDRLALLGLKLFCSVCLGTQQVEFFLTRDGS